MFKPLETALAGAALTLLAGCATAPSTSPASCLATDWYGLGVQDGQQGRVLGARNSIAASCAEWGVPPDMPAYHAGREAGLASFCRPERAFDLGASGSSYDGVCAAHDEWLFLSAYAEGREKHGLVSAVSSASSRLSRAESEISRIDRKIAEFNREIAQAEAGTRPQTDIAYNLSRIAELEADRQKLIVRDIADARADLRFAERELDRWERDFAVRQRERELQAQLAEAEARAAAAEAELRRRQASER
jgi:hypothetical protein